MTRFDDSKLIFLVSQPRSGSTVLQKVLGTHPSIETTGEPWIALYPLYALRERGVTAEFHAGLYRAAVREFLGNYPDGEQMWREAVRRMLSYLYEEALHRSGRWLFQDKTPRDYHILAELSAIFPAARFILLFRNPLSVLSSLLAAVPVPYRAGDLHRNRHDLLTAPGLLLEAGELLGARAFRVDYENFVNRPEEVARELCGFLGLPFREEMLAYGEQGGEVRWKFGDQGTVYRERRPVSSRTDRWMKKLAGTRDGAGWARAYLDVLGREKVEQMGYGFDELHQQIDSLNPADGGEGPTWAELIEKPAGGLAAGSGA